MASASASSAVAVTDTVRALESEQFLPSDLITGPHVPRRWGTGVLHAAAPGDATEHKQELQDGAASAVRTPSDSATGELPKGPAQLSSGPRRKPTGAAALAARAGCEVLRGPARAEAAEAPTRVRVPCSRPRWRGTRWGRCELCAVPLRPALREDGNAMLTCGKWRIGHTRRVLQQGTVEFDRLPDALRGRAVRGTRELAAAGCQANR